MIPQLSCINRGSQGWEAARAHRGSFCGSAGTGVWSTNHGVRVPFLWEEMNMSNFWSGDGPTRGEDRTLPQPHATELWWEPKHFVGVLQMDFSCFFFLLDSKVSTTF